MPSTPTSQVSTGLFEFESINTAVSYLFLTGLDETGKPDSWTAEGWAARIIQHEMDHLDGLLFTDSMLPKSLECVCWQDINLQNGLLELRYYMS